MKTQKNRKNKNTCRKPLLTFEMTIPVVSPKALPVNPIFQMAHFVEFRKPLPIVPN